MTRRLLVILALGVPAIGFAGGASELLARFVISATMEQVVDDVGGSNPTTAGVVTMNTAPWTHVIIDGEPRGTTPLFRMRLLPGQHSVRFVNEDKGISEEAKFDVQGGYLTKVRGSLEGIGDGASMQTATRPTEVAAGVGDLVEPGFLTADAAPWGRVYVDGKSIGSTPIYRWRVGAGVHKVEVRNGEAEANFHCTVDVTIAKGEVTKLRFDQNCRVQ